MIDTEVNWAKSLGDMFRSGCSKMAGVWAIPSDFMRFVGVPTLVIGGIIGTFVGLFMCAGSIDDRNREKAAVSIEKILNKAMVTEVQKAQVKWQAEAITAGVAEYYIIDPATGETAFRYIKVNVND